MSRPTTRVLVLSLAASLALTGVVLAGCQPGTRAAEALKAGNAALAKYAQLEQATEAKMAEAASVQPTPEGVQPGIDALAEVAKQMPGRRAAAAEALKQFQEFKAAATDDKQKAYAEKAIALAASLAALDKGTTTLMNDMTELYRLVLDNSADTARVSKLADAVSKGQTQYDKLSANVRDLSDAANAYYQANLAVKK